MSDTTAPTADREADTSDRTRLGRSNAPEDQTAKDRGWESPDNTKLHRGAIPERLKVEARNVHVHYNNFHAIKGVNLQVNRNEIMAFMGPSGCGKSTFLRCINRMNDTIEAARIDGEIRLDGQDVYHPDYDPVLTRVRIGMVAQSPNPFPKSIFDNVAFGPRLHGLVDGRAELEDRVESSLRRAGLWTEVKDKLGEPGTALSGGQQQRLCIARCIANEPEVILMDEPCSSLDPNSTRIIEDLMQELVEQFTVIIVTHNMEQAYRTAHRVAYFHFGEIIEVGPTRDVMENPQDQRTKDYVSGHIG